MPKSPSILSDIAWTMFPRSSWSAKKVTHAKVQTRISIYSISTGCASSSQRRSYLSNETFLFAFFPLEVRIPSVYPFVCRNGSVDFRILGGIECAVVRNLSLSKSQSLLVRQRRRGCCDCRIMRRLGVVGLLACRRRFCVLDGHFE